MTDNSGITLVHSPEGDWVGVYKDGKLIDQQHSFDESMLLDVLGIPHCVRWDWVTEENGWHLPDSLEEVVFEAEQEDE